MTDLAIREPNGAVAVNPSLPHDDPTAPLMAWARAAQAAHELAVPLCNTAFVPEHFRGKPDDATAAILYGAEAGLSPLQALQGVYVISGKPAMYTRTLMAVVLSKGHKVWTEELTDTRAIVCGRRRDSDKIERVVWTMERARKAGYTRNQKYATDPQGMLLSRGQADVCRRIAPDALLGMAYSVEEIEDEEPAPTVTMSRTTPTRRTAKRAPVAPAPVPEEPDLDDPTPAEAATDTAANTEPPDRDGLIDPRGPQMKKLHASLNDAGLTDREHGLGYITTLLKRDITSTAELTVAEASTVIDALEEPPFDPEPTDAA